MSDQQQSSARSTEGSSRRPRSVDPRRSSYEPTMQPSADRSRRPQSPSTVTNSAGDPRQQKGTCTTGAPGRRAASPSVRASGPGERQSQMRDATGLRPSSPDPADKRKPKSMVHSDRPS